MLFGELAISRGFITPAQRDAALKAQADDPARPLLGQVLLRQGALSVEQLVELLGNAAPSAKSPSLPSRYRLTQELGRGAMGTVHLADDATLGRPVAIKVLNDHVARSERVRQRFASEARLLARLNHTNIVRVHDADPAGFIVMELVKGRPIDDAVGASHDLRALAALFVGILDALQHAHDNGVVHRDLKPANILVDGTSVKVMDFGLARDLVDGSGLTAPGTVLGTPLYMSPEQVRGESVDARTDVYGAGAVLYRLLTDRPPHDGASEFEIFQGILARDPAPPRSIAPRVPIDLETICLKALRKDPRQRYRTAAEFRDDMARWLAGEAILASPPSWTDRVLRRVKRHAPRSLAMAAGIAIVIAVGWWLLLRSEAAGWAREADAKATSGDWQAARSLLDRARTRIAIDEELYRKVDAELKAREAEVARRAEIERVFGGVFAWLDSMPAYPINWKAGVRRLDEALRQMPGHADGWKRKGELHISLQQPDEALEAFGRAIAIAPTPVLHYLRGRIQLDAKRDKAAARTEFDAALRLDPSHQFSRLAQIRLAMMEGRRDEALRLCAESERHCSGFAQFFEVRAMARWMPPATPEDTAEVVRDFETAAAMADVDPSALLNLAMLKMGRDSGRALDLVNRAIEMAPNYALAHTYRALVRRALRDYDQALADAERALIINPSLPESVSAHALLLHDRGRTGEAIAQWKRALDLGGPLWDKRAQVMRWIDEAEKRK